MSIFDIFRRQNSKRADKVTKTEEPEQKLYYKDRVRKKRREARNTPKTKSKTQKKRRSGKKSCH